MYLKKIFPKNNLPIKGDKNKSMKNDFVVIDTETTGTDPLVDHVVEVAIVSISAGKIGQGWSTLVKPPCHIPAKTSAVHHISDADVEGAPSIGNLAPMLSRLIGDSVIVAHNAKFDKGFLPFLSNSKWLCSLRLARHLWPDFESHSNQALRYELGLRMDVPRSQRIAHSALDDARMTAEIFCVEHKKALSEVFNHAGNVSMDDLLGFVNSPYPVRIMNFGKHKGMLVKDLPMDYVHWLRKNSDDEDLLLSLPSR